MNAAAHFARPEARALLGLGVGGIGGLAADALGAPLAFMMGALVATMAAALLGAPVAPSVRLRSVCLVVIGLALGESASPELVGRLAERPGTLALALLYAPVAGAAAYAVYRRVGGLSPPDALFSAIPGGLSGVVLLSGALGADERIVALTQSLRVAIVVAAAPLLFFGLLGGAEAPAASASAQALTGAEALTLAAGAAAAIGLLRTLGAPLPYLLGPMLASAATRLLGLVEGRLPEPAVEIALVVVGAAIGCRFAGAPLGRLGRAALATLAGTGAMLAVSGLFAGLAVVLFSAAPAPALLAYAPGGVAEMALIALAIDADPGFVATHHLARLALILLATPVVGAWAQRRWRAERPPTADPATVPRAGDGGGS